MANAAIEQQANWIVLSLNPPWGDLIAACDLFPALGKHYETRSWRIRPGTVLAIYQTKGLARSRRSKHL